MTLFYYMDNKTRQSVGPVSMSTLVRMRKSGILDEDTFIRTEENPKWMRLSSLKEEDQVTYEKIVTSSVVIPQTNPDNPRPTPTQEEVQALAWKVGGIFAFIFLIYFWVLGGELPFGKKNFKVQCISYNSGSIEEWDFKDLDKAQQKKWSLDSKGHHMCSILDLP